MRRQRGFSLLEVILRLSDITEFERKRSQERQELLIAELNHRVRNILGLVRSLVSQTSTEDVSTAEFARVLDSRIHALARAHNQITDDHWGPAPMQAMNSQRIHAPCTCVAAHAPSTAPSAT